MREAASRRLASQSHARIAADRPGLSNAESRATRHRRATPARGDAVGLRTLGEHPILGGGHAQEVDLLTGDDLKALGGIDCPYLRTVSGRLAADRGARLLCSMVPGACWRSGSCAPTGGAWSTTSRAYLISSRPRRPASVSHARPPAHSVGRSLLARRFAPSPAVIRDGARQLSRADGRSVS
jgi:hypothetical protein